MIDKFSELMKKELAGLSLNLKDEQIQQFYEYYEMLIEWNKVVNLTAITEMEEVISKHFVDSLSLVLAERSIVDQEYSIIDVGTGAGFPGIPLKIAFPQLQITLLDSLNKRVKFLDEVCAKLCLNHIVSVHGRAEDFGIDKAYREKYDMCVSRAVANLSTLSEYCMPFVKTGGYFVSYKSGKVEEELSNGRKAVHLLGGKLEENISFELPGTDMNRILVKVKKIEPMSKKYPRKAGLPSKEPLK